MDIKKSVKDTTDNTRDAAREAIHRSTADMARDHREMNGDEMTAGEKVKSVGIEVKNRTQAELDKLKREVRSHT
jgi:hypothetical protein